MNFSLKQVKQIQQGLQKLLSRTAAIGKTNNEPVACSNNKQKHMKSTISYRLKHEPIENIVLEKQLELNQSDKSLTNLRKGSKTLVDAFINTIVTTNRFDCENIIDLNQLKSRSLSHKKEAEDNLLNMRIYIGTKEEQFSGCNQNESLPLPIQAIPSQSFNYCNLSKNQFKDKIEQKKSIIVTQQPKVEEEFKILKPSEIHKEKRAFQFLKPSKIQYQNQSNNIKPTEIKQNHEKTNSLSKIQIQPAIDQIKTKKSSKKSINKAHIRTEEQFLINKYNYEINQKQNQGKSQTLKNKYKNLDKRLEMIKNFVVERKPKFKTHYEPGHEDEKKQLRNYKKYSPLAKLYQFNNMLRARSSSSINH